jgi:hypothetical protein
MFSSRRPFACSPDGIRHLLSKLGGKDEGKVAPVLN